MLNLRMLTLIAVVLALSHAGEADQQAVAPSYGKGAVSYAVKFICGSASEDFQEGVVRGIHATAINIHNPSLTRTVRFAKRVSRALPYQRSGSVSAFTESELPPGRAIEVECSELRMRLPASMTMQFRTGFLVLLAERQLDVVAVYTSRPSGGEVATIDVETVAARALPEVESKLPDLAVKSIEVNRLRVDCPSGANSCITEVPVVIANIGAASAGGFSVRTRFDPAQSVVVDKGLPAGLGAGATAEFQVVTEPSKNCFDPDCTVCVRVDFLSEVAETDETNNKLCATRGG